MLNFLTISDLLPTQKVAFGLF